MRAIRDFILIICAITCTACLVYVVYNIELLRWGLVDASAALQAVVKKSPEPADDILKRFRKLDGPTDADSDGYSKPARESLKKLIEKPAAK